MTETRITVKTTVDNPPYRGKIVTYDVYADMKVYEGAEWQPLTERLLLQTALQNTACIPYGWSRKMYPLKDDDREWHDTYVESVEEIAPGHARVVIKTPYTD